MASGRARCTRKLRSWVVEQVESGRFPGVCWDNAEKTMFRIPWKHAGKQDFREDQDAAFFKAWAKFKGKDKEGDLGGPAVWKTRLRCALNKSPEFEEAPERGRMDVTEPYKVYRLLPPGAPPAQPGTKKRKQCQSPAPPEREATSAGSDGTAGPFCLQNLDARANGAASHSDGASQGSSSSSSSRSSSTEPQEGVDSAWLVGAAAFLEAPASVEPQLPADSDYSLLLTFLYGGRVVGEQRVRSLDCRLVAQPSESASGMEQVLFPKPDAQLEPARRLLGQLERGLLLASNSRGLFATRLCPVAVSWHAPQDPPGPGPHLLPSNQCVMLFQTAYFCRDLDRYFRGEGPRPKFQVTLHFWEQSRTPQNLITVRMEQAFARHFLEEASEEQTAAPFPQ
ncbi:interferon regulatory factor 9 [Perognathus longimembris pacificus]|uniref:interferon regulatory factor 9 n=1 Tax=Perognathus longimembris pacificus TaxID=214514 RepID=UPI002019DC3A|nr:interferon regulatory factor 9 [Perognathus longimembris pacificus]